MQEKRENSKNMRTDGRKHDVLDREELGALLRLFSSLGITVAFGIVLFFLAGLYLDRYLNESGIHTYNLVRIAGVLVGVSMSAYWAYLRIKTHLERFDGGKRRSPPRERDDV